MNTTKKIIMSSLLCALTFIATIVIKIPSPLNGYINLGDALVLLSGWLLSPLYAFLSAGLGSGLADVYSGYLIYAPATFVIKGVMAIIAHYLLKKKFLGGLSAELFMILGYYIFEGFLYGFIPSLVNIPPNAVQGAMGLIIGVVLINVFEKYKLIK